jgi:hypothetical protein
MNAKINSKLKPATIDELSCYKILMGDVDTFIQDLFRSTIKRGMSDLREIFAYAIGIDKQNIKVEYIARRYTISFPTLNRDINIKIEDSVEQTFGLFVSGVGDVFVLVYLDSAAQAIYNHAKCARIYIKKELTENAKITKARMGMMSALNVK